jgi:hypothetical protein
LEFLTILQTSKANTELPIKSGSPESHRLPITQESRAAASNLAGFIDAPENECKEEYAKINYAVDRQATEDSQSIGIDYQLNGRHQHRYS